MEAFTIEIIYYYQLWILSDIWCWSNRIVKNVNLALNLTFYAKINSKFWITDSNVKCKTVKLVEEITKENF